VIELAYILNYGTLVLVVALTSLGVAIGQGMAGYGAIHAINIQPMARNEITKTLVLSMALMETSGVLGIALGILLLLDPSLSDAHLASGIARCGIALSICLTGLTIGIVSAQPTRQACMSIARQPFFNKNILNLLLITQSLLQTPLLFGFLVAWLIKMQAAEVETIVDGWRLFSCGLVMGLGSIGPIIGLAAFAQSAVEGIGRNRKAYSKIVTFTFISEAIIETPILFSFVIAMIMLFSPVTPKDTFLRAVMMLAAAISTGFSTIAPGINSGAIASEAGRQIALYPEHYSVVARASMLAQALIDTFVLYAALTSLLILLIGR